MIDTLLPYYEQELSHLRSLAQEFARRYPKIASRLLLEDDNCADPQIERLLEGSAFLAARIHKKLDDEFPEIVEAFLEVLYPHYLRPTPALSIVEFQAGPGSTLTQGYRIARHTAFNTRKVNGTACTFRTCYPVDVWPIAMEGASFVELERSAFNGHSADLIARLQISLRATTTAHFGTLDLDILRFFLDGESTLMFQLYELLFNNVAKVTLSFDEGGRRCEVALPAESLKPVGYGPDEGLVDYSERSFLGYRLLHDYFTLPEKFLFFDLAGFARTLKGRNLNSVQINFYFSGYELNDRLSRFAQQIGRNHFKLGCTPVINLFKQQAEPITLTHTRSEYPVIPVVRDPRFAEVVSVDQVQRTRKIGREVQVRACHPYFEPRGDLGDDASYWMGKRRAAHASKDSGTEMFIRIVDRELQLTEPSDETLSISLTCSNRDLPHYLPYGDADGDFVFNPDAVVKIGRFLRKPTPTVRIALGDGLIWRLVSHLSLNHMSLVAQGRDVLLELLTLYNYRNTSAVRKQINGIVAITSEAVVARIGHPRPSFVRGVGITLELDESQYTGSGVFLFGQVLDHFFGQYCTTNSFTQLTLRTRQREKRIAQWPPRTGVQPLV